MRNSKNVAFSLAKATKPIAESQSAIRSQKELSALIALVLALLAALSAMVVWFALSFVAMGIDQARYRKVVGDALTNGTLATTYRLPFAPGKIIYVHGGNDCMILAMLITPRETRLKAAVSPVVPVGPARVTSYNGDNFPPDGSCDTLASLMQALKAHSSLPEITYYHRYVHGNVTTSALLLSTLSLQNATAFLLGICYALLACLIIASAIHVRSKVTSDRCRGVAFLCIGVSIALFYAVSLFDKTLCFAPMDIAVIGFILFGFFQPLARISEVRLIIATALFGSTIAIFDSLLGGIPVALSVLIVVVALGGASHRTVLIRRLILALGAFLAAIAFCLVFKQLLVFAIWGPDPTLDFASRLGKRIGGGVTVELSESIKRKLDEVGLSLQWLDSNLATHSVFAAIMVVYSSFVLAWGSHVVGAAIVILPVPLLLLLTYFGVRGRPLRRWPVEPVAMLGAALVPFGWYFLFLNHTILHSFIMVRPLALSVGLVMAAWTYRSLSTEALPEGSDHSTS